MKTKPARILYLQLPQIDNDVSGRVENIPLAAHYLVHAVQRSPEARYFSHVIGQLNADQMDDRHLVDSITRTRPDILVGTLYLWNIERFLSLAHRIRKHIPALSIFVGGPEVARRHPFLYRQNLIDAACTGEGEKAFPLMLQAWRSRRTPDCQTIGWRVGGSIQWGHTRLPVVSLEDDLPPPEDVSNTPDPRGMAYMETSRGCPMHCTFCCYRQQRRQVSFLSPETVERRIRILRDRGAREIRFIDPTFNSNPVFTDLLRMLVSLNQDRQLCFFAEIRADTLTEEQADLMKAARFTDVEVGVQSRSADVLRVTGRPTNQSHLEKGIQCLAKRRIHMTVDIMGGLPAQTPRDIARALRWAHRIQPATVQYLHTLLLPGTRLREQAGSFHLVAQPRPPYRVIRTPLLSPARLQAAELLARQLAGYDPDCATRQFVGVPLPDLFPEKVWLKVSALPVLPPGTCNRRCVIITGPSFYEHHHNLCRFLQRTIQAEPHTLWQFVLCVAQEEPLDVPESLLQVLRRAPDHWLDRFNTDPAHRLVARRLFITWKPSLRLSRAWQREAECLLSSACY